MLSKKVCVMYTKYSSVNCAYVTDRGVAAVNFYNSEFDLIDR